MSSLPIYLDYNATTPLDPAVRDAMMPYLDEGFGNPSSSHVYGQRAREAVATARRQVAELIGAGPDEIVFTSGGSEANNHALKGVCFRRGLASRCHLITSAVEHPAVIEPCRYLERLGCRLTIVPVDSRGRVDPADVARALCDDTALVSVMHANNEVGTIEPVREIAALCRGRGVLVHTDAAQSIGKVPVDVGELGVDLLTIAGHKLYAPKGIGVLYVRRGVELEPLVHGAAHESGRRAGTENVPYQVALGTACELAGASLAMGHLNETRRLRDRLWQRLREPLGDRVVPNGPPDLGANPLPPGEGRVRAASDQIKSARGLPNTLNVNFVGTTGAAVLAAAPGVAASTGAACHSDTVRLSTTLQAMGVAPELGRGAVRLSLGRFTTEGEVDRAAELLVAAYRRCAS